MLYLSRTVETHNKKMPLLRSIFGKWQFIPRTKCRNPNLPLKAGVVPAQISIDIITVLVV